MTKIILCGCNGAMGKAVTEFAKENNNIDIVAGVDITKASLPFPTYTQLTDVKENADVIIDFSHPSALDSVLDYCDEEKLSAVLCTTGYTDEQVSKISLKAKTTPLFYSRNMSLGVNLLIELAKKAEEVLGDSFDVEIIEKHHNQKIDAPSGTALMIADAINEVRKNELDYVYDRHDKMEKRKNNELGIHAVRGGTIAGEHEVIFAGKHEVLTISHSAQSKELFASGAIKAAEFMQSQPAGLYDMSALI